MTSSEYSLISDSMNTRTINGYLHPKLGSRNNDIERFQIKDDHMYLWRFSLQHSKCIIDHLAGFLSQEERQRAENYHFSLDRRQFIIRRGLLRTILGMILGVGPKKIGLKYSVHGKPFIDSDPQIFFNISFSGELGVIAISSNHKIGIDIELNRSITDIQQIAGRVFSPTEYVQWQNCDDHERIDTFYRLWTCKEALVKAMGVGLTFPLNEIEITFDEEHALDLIFRNHLNGSFWWSLFPLDVAAGYSACVAVDFRDSHILKRDMIPFHQVSMQLDNLTIKLGLAEIR